MTIRHLEIFAAVYRNRSLTRAAEQLHISQPTVSAALREMEEHYGTRLFDRVAHHVTVTPFGEQIYLKARGILEQLNDLSSTVPDLSRIRVGTGTAIGKLFMPSVVKAFRELHPQLVVTVTVGSSTQMCHMAMQNALDFVIAETVRDIPGLECRTLQRFPVTAVCQKDNPLTREKTVTAQMMAQTSLLLREDTSSTRHVVDDWFHANGMTVEPAWESSSVQTLMNACKAGLGVTFLSLGHVLAEHCDDLRILPLRDFNGEHVVNVWYHKAKQFTPVMEEFISFYDRYVRNMLSEASLHYRNIDPSSDYAFPDWQTNH